MFKMEPTYTVEVDKNEMEYIQCALTAWITNNRENAEKHSEDMLETIDGTPVEVGIWAEQHVEASKLLDKLIKIAGYDICQEGQ